MDKKTTEYYSSNSTEVFKRFESAEGGVSEYFDIAFNKDNSILDIGCGSGRDVKNLLSMGYDAYGIDPCSEFVDIIKANKPDLSERFFVGNLPNGFDEIKNRKFDGVLCSAVLMHIPDKDLLDSVYAIKGILNKNGKVLISIPHSRGDMEDDERDTKGRLMKIRDPWDLRLLFERVGFETLQYWTNEDSMKREGTQWTTFLFTYKEGSGIRPIDKIEGVLNRDKKDATYKLALFRALCDMALTEYNRIRWVGSNKVAVKLDHIAEKWLIYYWPIIENSKFIPQKRGEGPDSQKKIMFRNNLKELIDQYSSKGGLNRFYLDLMKDEFTEDTKKIYKKAFSKIRTAIQKGPVIYAGGSLESGTIFEYDPLTKSVLFNADLWRELVLMGHWIKDALILRWAELTSQISEKDLKPSEIIDLLLIAPVSERDTYDAKKVYKSQEHIECVWSGKSIGKQFDVDHAIPFSLWQNNDLWNLLPADSKVNNSKRDKLPTRGLIKERKDLIILYWSQLHKNMGRRFKSEIFKFTGVQRQLNWEIPLFSHFADAVEYTAIQRNIERWEP